MLEQVKDARCVGIEGIEMLIGRGVEEVCIFQVESELFYARVAVPLTERILSWMRNSLFKRYSIMEDSEVIEAKRLFAKEC